jgi:hypothetical protein
MNRILESVGKVDLLNQIFVEGGFIWDRKHVLEPKSYVCMEDLLLFCWEYNETYFRRQEPLEYRVTRDGYVQVLFCGVWGRPTLRMLKVMTKTQKEYYGHLVAKTLETGA